MMVNEEEALVDFAEIGEIETEEMPSCKRKQNKRNSRNTKRIQHTCLWDVFSKECRLKDKRDKAYASQDSCLWPDTPR